MKVSAEVICPFCDFVHPCVPLDPNVNRELFTCCTEDGGCDREFVVQMQIFVRTKTYKISDEPEQKIGEREN